MRTVSKAAGRIGGLPRQQEVREARTLPADRFDRRRQIGHRDGGHGLAVPQDDGELLLPEHGGRRGRDRSDLQRSQERQHAVEVRSEAEEDAIAALDAEPPERVADTVGKTRISS